MKQWLTLAVIGLVGSMLGVALKTVIANKTAAAQPPTSTSGTGS